MRSVGILQLEEFQFASRKLHAYGFSKNALNLMCRYLKNRKQRVQINNNLTATKFAIAGVPHGSVNKPLLFNLFVNDLVLFLT